MKSWFDLKIVISVMIVSLFVLALAMPAPSAQAQGTPKPTPTNAPMGGKDNNNNDDANHQGNGHGDSSNITANPAAENSSQSSSSADLSGLVFNYSAKAGQGGVVVRLQGEGWQAETTTDASGFYQFSGLGYGQATLKAQLPPGSYAVTPDWVVNLMANQPQTVNLGYYVGSSSPLPVRVSSQLKGQTLFIEVVNSLSDAVTNGRLEIRLPSGFEALPTMKATQGTVMYGVTTQRVQFETLAAGAKVQIEVPFQESSQAQGAGVVPATYKGAVPPPVFRVSFMYDQQQTPQLLIFAGDGTFFNRVAGAVVETVTRAAATTTMTTAATTTSAVTITTAMTMATILTPTTMTNTASQPPMLIPTTGYQTTYATSPTLLMGLIFGFGLVVSGWWSLRKKR